MPYRRPRRAPGSGRQITSLLVDSKQAFLYCSIMNMLQVIQRGDDASRLRCLPCPFCGSDPPLATRIAGQFVVGCESDDCAAHPQVAAASLDDAWDRWNKRA
jgi:hypothetical protein